MGGTLGKMRKIVWAQDYALKNGTPLIGFKDRRRRIQEGLESLSGYGEVFYRNVVLSGVVPQIAIIAGPCAGGASYSPALMDFIIMTRQNAQMFITGPQVIKSVSGRSVRWTRWAARRCTPPSAAMFICSRTTTHAIELTRRLLDLPSNNADDPPLAAPTLVGRSCAELQRTSFTSTNSAAKPSPFQRVASGRPEKPDGYWGGQKGQ